MRQAESRTYYEREILSILLEKYERSNAAIGGAGRRPQFRLRKSPLAAAYADELDADRREAIEAAAEELERQGMISVVWERHGTGRIERILLAVDAAQLYQRMGRTMPLMRVEEYRADISALTASAAIWVRRCCNAANEILSANKLPSFLPREKELRAGLIRAILSLPAAGENAIPKRVFSQRVFGDSKYFERCIEAPLLILLRRFAEEPCDTDAAYLDMAGITGHHGKVWIAGRMDFSLHGRAYMLADFAGGIELTYDTVAAMEIDALPPSILTVENLTNAETLAQEGADYLLIYTAGFPNRTIQALLSKIAGKQLPTVRHWGDLDYGGIRIFEYLRKHFFSHLMPYRMDVEELRAHRAFAQNLTDAQKKRLKALLCREDFALWHELIRVMLAEGIWLEQEALLWENDMTS